MSGPRQRADFIDATRGAAMLLVLAAHFTWIYFTINAGHERLASQIIYAMQVASPTFMMISGFLLGFVYRARGRDIRDFAKKLVDRGLFVLIVGHIVISMAYVSYAGSWSDAFRYAQITDAVAVAIIIGPVLVTRLGIHARLAVAVLGFVGCWLAIVLWLPETPFAQWAKDTLIGAESGRSSQWLYNFPIVPWFCLYLAATGLGEHAAGIYLRGDVGRVIRFLFALSAAGLLFTFGAKGAFWLVKTAFDPSPLPFAMELFAFTNPFQKLPPSLVYFTLNASIGTAMLATLLVLEQRGRLRRIVRLLSTIGQNSLFVFLLQEHVYVSGLWLLGPGYTPLWPLLFAVSVAFIVAITLGWHRLGGTRFFTVGYGRYWGWQLHPARSPTSP